MTAAHNYTCMGFGCLVLCGFQQIKRASCSLRWFKCWICTCSHELEPIDVQVRNVGEVGPLAERYQPVMALPTLSSVPAFTLNRHNAATKVSSSSSSSGNEISASMLRNVAYTGLQNQVDAVESMYRKTVRQLETLAHKACIDAVWKKGSHLILQMCVVMLVCGQERMMLRICYAARAAVVWYSLWAGAFGSTNQGSPLK